MILLSGGYRLFFPVAGLFSAILIPIWLVQHSGTMNTQVTVIWHMHEMLFGYLGAVLAGFLLTAIPNWTNRPAIGGAPLLALFALWLLGRAVMILAPDWAGFAVVFLVALAAIATHEIIRGGNTRNLVVAGMVWVLAACQATMLWGDPWLAQRMALALAVCMITLIGGRITPAFTRNWLKAQNRPETLPEFGLTDRLAIITTLVAMLAWVIADTGLATGGLALLAAGAQAVRLIRWNACAVRQEPLMLALHLAYAWLPVSMLFLAADGLSVQALEGTVTHALGAGAVGTMTLIVMIRAILGHSGRPIVGSRLDVIALSAVHVSAVIRIAAMSFSSDNLLIIAGGLWSLGFVAFGLRAVPLALSRKE